MAKEHEAGRNSIQEILIIAKREQQGIISKIDGLQSKSLMEEDRVIIAKSLDNIEVDFNQAWNDRKQSLTRHAKFCLFAGNLQQLSVEINELTEMLKVKTGIEESLSSVIAASTYLNASQDKVYELSRRVTKIKEEGNFLSKNLTEHQATIDMGLKQVTDKWKGLQELIKSQQQKLGLASEYFQMLEKVEMFLKEANRTLLDWSKQIPTLKCSQDATDLKKEIEIYVKANKTAQNDMLVKMTAAAGQVFGQSAYQKTKLVQKDHEDTFDAISNLILEITNQISARKSAEEDNLRNKRMQAEAEANIRAAKAEAEAARLAAIQAEEARRIAEEASKSFLMEASKTTKVICIETQTEEVAPPRPPPPVEEAPRAVAPLFDEYLQDMVLKEGSKCVFKARVTGTPLPQITWFKDGVSVQQTNADYRASMHGDGVCLLTIDETMPADSANWSVRASNQAGYAESHAKLTVLETEPVVEKCPPSVTKPMSHGKVTEGQPFEMTCKFDGNPQPTFSWFKNGVCIDKSRSFTIGEFESEQVLKIEKVQIEDTADYTCEAWNQLGKANTSGTLSVTPNQPVELPCFDESLANVEVHTGQPLTLQCSVAGLPSPDITWYHYSKQIKRSPGVEMRYDGGTATLSIAQAFPKNAGQYVCKAKNKAGEATSTSQVTIKSMVPDTSDSEAPSEAENISKIKPAFYVPLRNQTALVGEEIIIECVIAASPEATVQWYKDDIPLKESRDVTLLKHGDSCQLVLKNTSLKTAGEIKVRAANELGECQSTCNLEVKNKPKSSFAIATQTSDSNLVAPKFSQPIQGTIAEEGIKVALHAHFVSTSQPQVLWLHNGKPVQPKHDVKIDSGPTKSSLIFTKVKGFFVV